jgi:hypothetical protein
MVMTDLPESQVLLTREGRRLLEQRLLHRSEPMLPGLASAPVDARTTGHGMSPNGRSRVVSCQRASSASRWWPRIAPGGTDALQPATR